MLLFIISICWYSSKTKQLKENDSEIKKAKKKQEVLILVALIVYIIGLMFGLIAHF